MLLTDMTQANRMPMEARETKSGSRCGVVGLLGKSRRRAPTATSQAHALWRWSDK